MPTRREIVRAGALAGLALVAPRARAQAPLTGSMDETRLRSVRLPPKGNVASMSPDERDALEHRLHCQCGCRLDIYTCRTTDFTCPVSPSMHRDVVSLVPKLRRCEWAHIDRVIVDARRHVALAFWDCKRAFLPEVSDRPSLPATLEKGAHARAITVRGGLG